MTLPTERTQAVLETERFLKRLCDSKVTPNVQRSIRAEAAALLRHFPTRHEIRIIPKAWNDKFVSMIFECPFGEIDGD